MTITRFLLPGVVLGALAAPCAAQFGGGSGSQYPLVPSVRPAGGDGLLLPVQEPPAAARPPMVTSLEQMGTPQAGGAPADPVGTLTGVPNPAAPGLPLGSYPS